MSVEFSGKSWEADAGHQKPTTREEAEGKLILYLPHLCLHLQLSFSLGDIVIQLLGFGMGDV